MAGQIISTQRPLSASNVLPDPRRETRDSYAEAGWGRVLKTHPAIPAAVYLPLTCWALWRSFWHPGFIGSTWCRFGAGLLAWTLMEYVIHRWFLHSESLAAWYNFGTANIHLSHHEYPDDISQVILSPAQTLPGAAVIYGFLRLFLSGPAAGSIMAGLLVGYLGYETFHFLEHAPVSLPWTWLSGLRKYHARHHFEKPYGRFGVTTPLWDYVFKT